jgi:hypothetical protein
LLYEEGGFGLPGEADPFAGGRFSGLLPALAGVEVLGGPYLHVALKTNFTQFGEGKLFGLPDWDRDHFTRYAAIYRPYAILCWSRHARAFCLGNADLVEVLDDDGAVLIARIRGGGGAVVHGQATVAAQPGVLSVGPGPGAELDGPAVLRYHFVPTLRANPRTRLRPVPLAGDPVPFIELEVPRAGVTLELAPWSGRGTSGEDR